MGAGTGGAYPAPVKQLFKIWYLPVFKEVSKPRVTEQFVVELVELLNKVLEPFVKLFVSVAIIELNSYTVTVALASGDPVTASFTEPEIIPLSTGVSSGE